MFKKTQKQLLLFVLFIFIFTAVSGIVFAKTDSDIVNIKSNEIVPQDKFFGGRSLTNAGTVKGDLIFGAQYAISSGKVEGDFIGAASDINLSGNVLGNARMGGGTLDISGSVGKNVNAFGGKINITDADIGGSLLAFGGEINVSGKVNGYTRVYGGKITLNGEFFGDVDARTDFSDEKLLNGKCVNDFKRDAGKFSNGGYLTVFPGTIIHGKLTYHGTTVNLEKGAQITDFQWIKPKVTPLSRQEVLWNNIWRLVKVLFSTAIYFLIGLMLYKLFPVAFRRQGENIRQKPLTMAGAGTLTIVSTIIAFVIFVTLLLLSFSILSPAVGLIFGVLVLLGYILLCVFSIIPVAVWLGDLIYFRAHDSVDWSLKFGVGLAVITLGLFILKLLAGISTVSFVFSIISFIVVFILCILGIGALVYMMRDLCKAAGKGEKTE